MTRVTLDTGVRSEVGAGGRELHLRQQPDTRPSELISKVTGECWVERRFLGHGEADDTAATRLKRPCTQELRPRRAPRSELRSDPSISQTGRVAHKLLTAVGR